VDSGKGYSLGVKSKREGKWNALMHVFFILYSLCCVMSIIIVISTSLSDEMSVLRNGFGIIPQGFTFSAYKSILAKPMVLARAYLVTITVSLAGCSVGLFLVSSLGYVLSRPDFILRKQLSFFVFFTMLFNGGVVPFYILISMWLGLKNNVLALILPYLVSAWYVLLMKGYMAGIPFSLIESAKIDGAGELRIFFRIVVPISKPALATVGLFLLLQYWNDWWLSMLFITREELYSLQYLLVRILNNIEFLAKNLHKLVSGMARVSLPTITARFAMCILAAGPMLFVFMFFQRFFMRGIVVGSIKE